MKQSRFIEYFFIFSILLLQGFRIPESDVIDYLVFSNLVNTLSFQEIAILINKDFVFWSILKILPLTGFSDLLLIELTAKILIFERLRKNTNRNIAFLWILFPITISTSFHLIKQNLACAFLFLAFTSKRLNKIKWLTATSIHLSSGLFAPIFVKSKILFYLGSSLVGFLIFKYIFEAPEYGTSVLSWGILTYTILALYQSKNFRKVSIYFLFVIGVFSLKGNYIGAIRIFYYLVPFIFFIQKDNKFFRGSNFLSILIFLIIINIFASPWEYSLTENLFTFKRATYSLDVSYE